MGALDNKQNGSMPSGGALLVIDMISDFEFEDGETLYEYALPVARQIREFKLKASSAGLPVIYINDNFGKWHHDFKAILRFARESEKGKAIMDLLQPGEDDYFVLKPKHSAFYSTALEVLLEHLQVRKLALTGVTSDICILFTANDAYMRDYELYIPADCVAAVEPAQNEYALEYMERVLKSDTRPWRELEIFHTGDTKSGEAETRPGGRVSAARQ